MTATCCQSSHSLKVMVPVVLFLGTMQDLLGRQTVSGTAYGIVRSAATIARSERSHPCEKSGCADYCLALASRCATKGQDSSHSPVFLFCSFAGKLV